MTPDTSDTSDTGMSPRPLSTTPHLCRSKVKKTALEFASIRKNGSGNPRFTRVSATFLGRIEAKLRAVIASEVHQHPSVGKTLI